MLQILKDEKHPTTEERLLKYATDSFQRLLPKLQIQVLGKIREGFKKKLQFSIPFYQHFYFPTIFLHKLKKNAKRYWNALIFKSRINK